MIKLYVLVYKSRVLEYFISKDKCLDKLKFYHTYGSDFKVYLDYVYTDDSALIDLVRFKDSKVGVI